jgi:hypothetical protein
MPNIFQRQITRTLSDLDWHPVMPSYETVDIYLYDYAYCRRPKQHAEWVLGACVRSYRMTMMSVALSPAAFFRFPFSTVHGYLSQFHATLAARSPALEIMMVYHLGNFSAFVVIKTHWLRLVQRRWKAVFRERAHVARLRRHPNALNYRQRHGTFPPDLALPTLAGMLAALRQTTA